MPRIRFVNHRAERQRKSHQEWQAAKSKLPTIREQIRRDIDDLIGQSLNFTTFLDSLRKAGYQIHAGKRKHTAVKPPYGKGFIRLDSLGENYTDAAIEQRIFVAAFAGASRKSRLYRAAMSVTAT